MSLRGKSIFIAGATGGLGQAVVTELASQEATMMLVHHGDSSRASELKNKLKDQPNITFYSCDFTNADEIHDAIETFFDQAKEPYGLINLVGHPARVDW
ncbi:MAG TPA: SDR family NAD(P)-dependent oxidoreductase, partial [Acidobacteriota bacterium]|nr:SDR family NAD(P)-dependent oxidoreductase [Acidobacteriota bacterium]